MRIDEISNPFSKASRAQRAGQAQAQSTVASMINQWNVFKGRQKFDVNDSDDLITYLKAFLDQEGFEEDVIDQAMQLATKATMGVDDLDMDAYAKVAIKHAVERGNQYRGDIKIPAEIIDAVKKLNLPQRQLLAQVLTGATRAR